MTTHYKGRIKRQHTSNGTQKEKTKLCSSHILNDLLRHSETANIVSYFCDTQTLWKDKKGHLKVLYNHQIEKLLNHITAIYIIKVAQKTNQNCSKPSTSANYWGHTGSAHLKWNISIANIYAEKVARPHCLSLNCEKLKAIKSKYLLLQRAGKLCRKCHHEQSFLCNFYHIVAVAEYICFAKVEGEQIKTKREQNVLCLP